MNPSKCPNSKESNCNLSSIESYKKYGITRSTLSYMLQHMHQIPVGMQDTLESYYLLYWTSYHTIESIKEGTLASRGRKFHVVFLGTTLGELKTLPSYSQIKLSFRIPKPEFNLPSYVIITKPFTPFKKNPARIGESK